jgi:hypothetical protein
VAEEERDEVLPESSLGVVVRSLEIQDAEPIRSAPMSETTTTSRGGIELLADDLVDPVAVARNLEAARRGMQAHCQEVESHRDYVSRGNLLE